jgi:hypothetical protein
MLASPFQKQIVSKVNQIPTVPKTVLGNLQQQNQFADIPSCNPCKAVSLLFSVTLLHDGIRHQKPVSFDADKASLG